jgi:hypothetical protein
VDSGVISDSSDSSHDEHNESGGILPVFLKLLNNFLFRKVLGGRFEDRGQLVESSNMWDV